MGMFLLGFFWKKTHAPAAIFATVGGPVYSIFLKFPPAMIGLLPGADRLRRRQRQRHLRDSFPRPHLHRVLDGGRRHGDEQHPRAARPCAQLPGRAQAIARRRGPCARFGGDLRAAVGDLSRAVVMFADACGGQAQSRLPFILPIH